jgi:Histidyl-tRNA synthetase
MSKTIQAVRGMNDMLPEAAPLWEFFEDTVRDWLRSYGYQQIRHPSSKALICLSVQLAK